MEFNKKTIKENIIFKIHSDNRSGLGHLIRCLRIAHHIPLKYKIYFIIDKIPTIKLPIGRINYIELYKNKKFINQANDLKNFQKQTQKIKFDIIIIDDYRIGFEWQKKIKKNKNKIVVIDDLLNRKIFCDYYINYKVANKKKILAKCKKYLPPQTNLLIGSKYLIIDKKLRRIKIDKKKLILLINFGNSFNFKKIKLFLKKVYQLRSKKLIIYICLGIYASNYKYLFINKEKKVFFIKKKIFIENYLNRISLFLGSSGQSIYDMSYLNVPSFFFTTQENQNNDKSDMKKLGHEFFYNIKDINTSRVIKKFEIFLKNHQIQKIKMKKKSLIINKGGVKNIVKKIGLI